MTPEKQIEKLHEAMTILNRDNATSEDVIKIFGKALEAIASVKKQLTEQISSNHTTLSVQNMDSITTLTALQSKLTILEETLPKTEIKMTGDMDKLVVQVYKEVKRIEQLIPTLPDLTPLEAKIKEVESKIPTLEKMTAKKVRDKLETLKGDERLDVEAINNLPKFTVSRDAPESPMVGDIWCQTL